MCRSTDVPISASCKIGANRHFNAFNPKFEFSTWPRPKSCCCYPDSNYRRRRLPGIQCSGFDQLLFVVDRAEVANRAVTILAADLTTDGGSNTALAPGVQAAARHIQLLQRQGHRKSDPPAGRSGLASRLQLLIG